MGKFGVFSGKEIRTILEQHGFVEVRRHGSHVVMQKQTPGSTLTVPVPDHKTLKIGTLQSIIRQSGIERSAFER